MQQHIVQLGAKRGGTPTKMPHSSGSTGPLTTETTMQQGTAIVMIHDSPGTCREREAQR